MTIEEIIQSGHYTLIDVREESELENDGYIESAIHIPLGEIPHEIEKIESFQKPIILFCRSGNRSGKAVEFLENQGLDELYNGGGYEDLVKIVNQ